MTSPSFCTNGHQRVYITAYDSEICFGPMHGIEQSAVFRFEKVHHGFSSCRIAITNLVGFNQQEQKYRRIVGHSWLGG